jgi:hypothetical protein
MFALGVIEHLRLNCDLVVQNYTTHARAADRLAALSLKAKMVMLALSALAALSIVLTLFRPAREYQITAAILATAALALQIASVAYGIEARVHSHRLLAHRLWLMCEQYRGLLTEIHDGLLDNASILRRREMLSEQLHAMYEQGFPIDQQAFESMRQPQNEGAGEPSADSETTEVVPARKAG